MRLKPVLFAIFCSLAALADAADPMESLTALRDAAIKNDIDAAMSFVVDKYTDEIIKTNKIPKELRDMLINLTGAFENTSVRAADAGRAEICATVRDKNGKDQSIRITMLLKDANFRFSTFSTQALPGAKIYLDEFLKALNEGDTAAAATYLTDELAKEFADGFPDALRLQCDNKVSAPRYSGEQAVFPVERMGEKGSITLTRTGLLWKISAVSKNLQQNNAAMIIIPYTEYCRIFAGQLSRLHEELTAKAMQADSSGNGTDEVKSLIEAFLQACAQANKDEIRKHTSDSFPELQQSDIQELQQSAKAADLKIEMILFPSEKDAEVSVRTNGFYNIFKVSKENEQWKITSFISGQDINKKRESLIDKAELAARTEELLLALLFKSRSLIHPDSFTLLTGGIETLKNSELASGTQARAMIFEKLAEHFASFAGFKGISSISPEANSAAVTFKTDKKNSAKLQIIQTGSAEEYNLQWHIQSDPELLSLIASITQKLQEEQAAKAAQADAENSSDGENTSPADGNAADNPPEP